MKFTSVAVGILGLALTGCLGKANLDNSKARYSYTIGYRQAENAKKRNLDIDVAAFSAAFKDVQEGKASQLTDEQMREAEKELFAAMQEAQTKSQQAEDEKSGWNKDPEGVKNQGLKYLAENKEKPGVKTTASGLQYKVLKAGNGKKPTADSTVTVHYTGKLLDGTVFDSSVERGQPAEFPLNGVIRGWTEGVQLMNEGSKFEFTIPQELAYGEQGSRPKIQPFSTLVFEVELIKVAGGGGEKSHAAAAPAKKSSKK